MIALGMLALSSTAAVAPPITGDFDGDGKADAAAIVRQSDGARVIMVTFNGGRQQVVDGVDEHAVLTIVPPAEIEAFCKPIARAAPVCSRQFSGHDRDGLRFTQTRQKLSTLALWNGTHFMRLTSIWRGQK